MAKGSTKRYRLDLNKKEDRDFAVAYFKFLNSRDKKAKRTRRFL